jgi:hypothetical protein
MVHVHRVWYAVEATSTCRLVSQLLYTRYCAVDYACNGTLQPGGCIESVFCTLYLDFSTVSVLVQFCRCAVIVSQGAVALFGDCDVLFQHCGVCYACCGQGTLLVLV